MSDPYNGTTLMFCDIVSPPEPCFAWLPTKCFDGTWMWMRPMWRRLCVVKAHLARGPEEPWWQYARVK